MSHLFEEPDYLPSPIGTNLADGQRCRLVKGASFAMSDGRTGFDPQAPGRAFDAVLVYIDHAPDHPLAHRPTGFHRTAAAWAGPFPFDNTLAGRPFTQTARPADKERS